jgi:hypothetical protein
VYLFFLVRQCLFFRGCHRWATRVLRVFFFVCGAIMEQLPTKEQEKIRKMSDVRLTSSLTKAGVTTDELEAMNRSQMIERWAKIAATGGISTPPSGNPAKLAGGYDVALERERLTFEKQKWEAEAALEKEKISLERAKLEAQKEERERLASELKAKEEKECAERQNRFVAEDKFREQQLMLQAEQIKLERERRETKVSQLKHYGDAIRNSVSKLKENSPLEFIPFINNFERLFAELKVPSELRVALITPYLSEQCRNLVSRLEGSDVSSYDFVKTYLMRQLRLVPTFFIDEFNRCTRRSDETFKGYASRLSILLSYYLDSRKVKDFESLVQLIVCDRIKSVLPEGALSHLLRYEATLSDQWATRDQLADVLDTYQANYDRFDKPKAMALGANSAQLGNSRFNNFRTQAFSTQSQNVKSVMPDAKDAGANTGRTGYRVKKPVDLADKVCFRCGEKGHLRSACGINSSQTSVAARKSQQSTGGVSKPNARVFRCTASSGLTGRATDAPVTVDGTNGAVCEPMREAVSSHVIETRTAADEQLAGNSGHGQGEVVGCSTTAIVAANCRDGSSGRAGHTEERAGREAGTTHLRVRTRDLPVIITDGLPSVRDLPDSCESHDSPATALEGAGAETEGPRERFLTPSLNLAALDYMDVTVKGIELPVRALVDGGSQINVVNNSLIEPLNLQPVGNILIRGIVGQPVTAQLVQLQIGLSKHEFIVDNKHDVKYISILCAACDDLNENLIITLPVADQLKIDRAGFNDVEIMDESVHYDSEAVAAVVTRSQANRENSIVAAEVDLNINNESKTSDARQNSSFIDVDDIAPLQQITKQTDKFDFGREQSEDELLSHAFNLARQGKGNYLLRDGLLYRKENLYGQQLVNLVVPKSRHLSVLQLAHNSCHFSGKRTYERIIMSGLTWGSGPDVKSVRASAIEYAANCPTCQMHARTTCFDRVPIKALPREPSVFRHLQMDVFGPIVPNERLKFNYALLVICVATRYPWAFPLRTATAKNVCDALLKMFEVTGIASEIVVTSDNASYNRSILMREFMKRLGITPRFSTPYHPEGHSVAERGIQTLQNVIVKLAGDHKNGWTQHLGAALWALRETKNATTGLPPHLLVFGYLPKGPLAIST